MSVFFIFLVLLISSIVEGKKHLREAELIPEQDFPLEEPLDVGDETNIFASEQWGPGWDRGRWGGHSGGRWDGRWGRRWGGWDWCRRYPWDWRCHGRRWW